MTREEAIERLKTDIYKYADFKENPNENEFWMAFDMAIKALEQEPILDKIRAEIEEQVLESLSDGGDDWFTAEKVYECLEIIDKYKAEGSGE